MCSIFMYSERPILERPVFGDELGWHAQRYHVVNAVEVDGCVPGPGGVHGHSMACAVQYAVSYYLQKRQKDKKKKRSKK